MRYRTRHALQPSCIPESSRRRSGGIDGGRRPARYPAHPPTGHLPHRLAAPVQRRPTPTNRISLRRHRRRLNLPRRTRPAARLGDLQSSGQRQLSSLCLLCHLGPTSRASPPSPESPNPDSCLPTRARPASAPINHQACRDWIRQCLPANSLSPASISKTAGCPSNSRWKPSLPSSLSTPKPPACLPRYSATGSETPTRSPPRSPLFRDRQPRRQGRPAPEFAARRRPAPGSEDEQSHAGQ